MQTNDETVAQLKKKEKALRGEASKLQKGIRAHVARNLKRFQSKTKSAQTSRS
jgi:hypothetical protein